MEDFNRRKFLRSLLLGTSILLIPPVFFGKNNSDDVLLPSSTGVDDQEIFNLSVQAKIAFYKKDYTQAEMLYKKLIMLNPSDVKHYDGLRKVYGVQQKLFEIVSLYREGFTKNPNQPVFVDRTARSMNAIALGNKKEEINYKKKFGSDDMLLASMTLYIMSIPRFPKEKSLRLGLLDTFRNFDKRNLLKKLSEKIPTATKLSIQHFINNIKDNRAKGENMANKPVMQYIDERVQLMETKKRRELYFEKEIKERIKAISNQEKYWEMRQLREFLNALNYVSAKEKVEKILRKDPGETYAIGLFKKKVSKTKNYDVIVSFYEERYKTKKDFWTLTAYAAALRKADVQKHFNLILSLYREAENMKNPLNEKAIRALYGGRGLCYFANRNFVECREEILRVMNITHGCGGVSIHLIIRYAESYASENESGKALELLNLLKNKHLDRNLTLDDPILHFIQPSAKNNPEIYNEQQMYPHKLSKDEQLDILYAIARIQKQQQDTVTLNQTLNEIRSMDSNNRFASKFI